MENQNDLFMWNYQQHVRIVLQMAAESLFKEIDPKFRPSIFLLGVLVGDRKDKQPVCLEPENCGYSVNAFNDIKKIAGKIEKAEEKKRALNLPADSITQENQDKRISNGSYIKAINMILKREDIYDKTEEFVSSPTYVEGFLVFVILEMQSDALKKYYSLTKNKRDDLHKINRSFIESAVDMFLKEATNALKDPNNTFAIERQTEELLRESAKQFMYSISSAGENSDGLHGLFDNCNTIASLRYEGAESLGKMIIAKKDHPNVRYTLHLEEPIKITDFRKVRKFLELSGEHSLIISDSAFIYGLGEQVGKYNPKEESLFTISFISHYGWEVLHDNNSMMIVEYKQPNILKEKIDRDKFYSDLKRIFTNIDKSQLDDLWDITIQATKQKHGTMLVISDNAPEEAERLGKQSFTLTPIKLTPNLVQQITSIDGAVLVDRNSICHAIGIILDGLATDKGDSSRGARYNSAIRYYECFGKNHPTVLVIISEDGMINLIPNLNPQIKHSAIIDAIDSLKMLAKHANPDKKQFNYLMNYFENVEFYLSAGECNTINALQRKIEDKDKDEGLRIKRQDFKPNSEMNDSYYLDRNAYIN